MIRAGQTNLQQARKVQLAMLRASTQANADPESPVKIAMINNAIAEEEFEQPVEVPIEMTAAEKTQYDNEWRKHRERNALLSKHKGQAFSLILGQCTQLLLLDQMKQDTDYAVVKTSYDPLLLYRLIE
jgi:hypothetical protein